MATDNGTRNLSVTAGDVLDSRRGMSGLSYLNFIMPYSATAGLPGYWSHASDYLLRTTLARESLWAGAVYKAATKISAQGFDIEDKADSRRRTQAAQGLLIGADGGNGSVAFLMKLILDWLLTDNGAALEVVRAGNAQGGRVLALFHLDSCRTRRTGDPQYPAVYTSLDGKEHALRDFQVILGADFPSPDAGMYGVSMGCAARHCWSAIERLASIDTYYSEKITGQNRAVHVVGGVTRQNLLDAFGDAAEVDKQKGFVIYKGQILIPMLDLEKAASIASIDLASIPDGFDAERERQHAARVYANRIGIPVQEVIPLSGQGLGTGAQTRVLDESSEGLGLAAFRKWLEHALTHLVLPASTTFTLGGRDIRDQRAEADLQLVRAQRLQTMMDAGILTTQQALQLAVDDGDIPEDFLPQGDTTPGGTLTDMEKPDSGGDSDTTGAPGQLPTPAQTPSEPERGSQPGPRIFQAKEAQKPDIDLDELFEAEMAAAAALAREAMRR